uniref:KIAA1328 n=1 Tax=Sphenodon punctatus TaxID=8508 RepID=A0A8D0HA51_SPHPU
MPNQKSPCQPPLMELDGSYLSTVRPQTHRNSKTSKSGSPTLMSLSQHCRNNCNHGMAAHYTHQEDVNACQEENGLHSKCNNMRPSAKQRDPFHTKMAHDVGPGMNGCQGTCRHQMSRGCGYPSPQSSDRVHVQKSHPISYPPDYPRFTRDSGPNDSMDSGSKGTERSKKLSEEKRQQLMLQKMELEIEKERLQNLLAKQEAKLLLKQQQLHQSRLAYHRFRGQACNSEELLIDEVLIQPGSPTPILNGTVLSSAKTKCDGSLPKTPASGKACQLHGSTGGNGSGRKTVGFSANVEEEALWIHTKKESSRPRKGTASGSRKDAATSPVLTRSQKELVTTATSPIQHDTSR